MITCTLSLPDDTVGMLIGRRGNTISSIRRECAGVRIDIESPAEGNETDREGATNAGSREVILRCTIRATSRAHQMIAALVENDMRRKSRKLQGEQRSSESEKADDGKYDDFG